MSAAAAPVDARTGPEAAVASVLPLRLKSQQSPPAASSSAHHHRPTTPPSPSTRRHQPPETPQASSSRMAQVTVKPARAQELADGLADIRGRLQQATRDAGRADAPRLILASKLKPASDVLALHQHDPHIHFGENYAQELEGKAELLPRDIRWHMIGALQTNKCKPLAERVENLWCVSSVDSAKKASKLDDGRAALQARLERDGGALPWPRLHVQVQVNTSGEAEKSGVEPDEAPALCEFVATKCPHLELVGLMTIGAIARSIATGEGEDNEDFAKLIETRERVAAHLGRDKASLQLSMGMTNDFEGAIKVGAGEVRIGEAVFGKRGPRHEAKVLDDEDAAAFEAAKANGHS